MSKTIYDGSNLSQGSDQPEKPQAASGPVSGSGGTIVPKSKQEELKQANLIGFLISYSKTGFGEQWELREGNLYAIGKAADCPIRLQEASISDHHATLHIRRSNDSEKRLMIVITDTNSTNGTVVNSKDIGINGHVDLKNLDKIIIGQYELALFLIDKEGLQLQQNPNFKPLNEAPAFDYSSQSLYNKPTQIS